MSTQRIAVPGAQLAVDAWGSGEPIVFMQTALTADELRPLARAPALEHGYRKVLYHRRGYAGSTAVHGPGSIRRDAADCDALLAAMGIARAHVVGLSYSAAVALQLAADAPARVHTLTLLEPPPVHTPSAAEFRAANDRLQRTRRVSGPAAALDAFLSLLIGPGWRQDMDRRLPGSVTQMRRDATTFFDTDMPALLRWRFGPADARRIGCPVLYIGGTDSGPWFAEVRELVRRWLPSADDAVVQGADHSLAMTHAREVAHHLVTFVRRHPLPRARA